MATVIAVVAHPDDEILGCGGTLARHAAEGDRVEILIVAEGATSRQELEKNKHEDAVNMLRDVACSAAECLGVQKPRFIGLPDNRMDSLDLLSVIQAIEDVFQELKPKIVYTHHGGDVNVDHQIVHRAVVTASRPVSNNSVRQIYSYESVSSTEWASRAFGAHFQPTRFVNIDAYMDRKRAALEAYSTEMRPFPHPRSFENVEHLARLRGATAGMLAAEAFEVVRDYVN